MCPFKAGKNTTVTNLHSKSTFQKFASLTRPLVLVYYMYVFCIHVHLYMYWIRLITIILNIWANGRASAFYWPRVGTCPRPSSRRLTSWTPATALIRLLKHAVTSYINVSENEFASIRCMCKRIQTTFVQMQPTNSYFHVWGKLQGSQ